MLIMTPEKQDKTLELSKHLSPDSTPARNGSDNENDISSKSVKCEKICSKYLTDIPRQREEYGMPYHFYFSSWSGISVLFYDKLTLHFCHKMKQSFPNPTRRGLSGRSPT